MFSYYSREPKSVIFFNYSHFFSCSPDINQSEVTDSFQLASDWIKSIQKNAFGLLAVKVKKHLKRQHFGGQLTS